MRIRNAFIALIAGLSVVVWAGAQAGPSAEARAALTPTGKLRVGFLMAPIYGLKDPASGELKGLGMDMGKEMARQLGVPFEVRPYKDLEALIEGAKAGDLDVALTTADEKRKAVLDFTEPYLFVEHGYLVRAGVPAKTMADVDKAGIRVGVLKKSATQTALSKTLKHATLVEADTLPALKELVVSGKVDAIAIGKPFLFGVEAKLPGSRVLDGVIRTDDSALGVVKGRKPAALAYARQFIEEVKAGSMVKTAIERDKLKAAHTSPPR
jgi:polar amino acid transport system substrate-binding protein